MGESAQKERDDWYEVCGMCECMYIYMYIISLKDRFLSEYMYRV